MISASEARLMMEVGRAKKAQREPRIIAFYTKAFLRMADCQIRRAAKKGESYEDMKLRTNRLGFIDGFIAAFLPFTSFEMDKKIWAAVSGELKERGFKVSGMSDWTSGFRVSWE
jgi:hypothetical protein